MIAHCARVFRFGSLSRAVFWWGNILFILFSFTPSISWGQSEAAALSASDDQRTSANEQPVSQNAAVSMAPSAKGGDAPARLDPLVRYLIAGGLMLGGIVLAVPPIYYLALGDRCNVERKPGLGCADGYRPMAWYDYAGLTLGGLMIGAGVAVLVWPTPSATGEQAANLVFYGSF